MGKTFYKVAFLVAIFAVVASNIGFVIRSHQVKELKADKASLERQLEHRERNPFLNTAVKQLEFRSPATGKLYRLVHEKFDDGYTSYYHVSDETGRIVVRIHIPSGH